MSDFKVKIEYKNKNLETIVEKEYDFVQYTEVLHLELMKIISEVEDAFYVFSGNKQKKDWDEETQERFQKIRHKILDQANAIKRLPNTLSYKGVSPVAISSGEYIARQLNSGKSI